MQCWKKALCGEETENYELTLMTKAGQPREILLNATPRCGPDGNPFTQTVGPRRKRARKVVNQIRARPEHRVADPEVDPAQRQPDTTVAYNHISSQCFTHLTQPTAAVPPGIRPTDPPPGHNTHSHLRTINHPGTTITQASR